MDLLNSIWNVFESFAGLLLALIAFIAPWAPLICWIAFWLFAVNWKQLYPILMRGGLVGVVLTAFMAVLVWSAVSPPPGGVHHLYGLEVSNGVGKFVYVTSLTVIAWLCGSVQLSGSVDHLCQFAAEEDGETANSHGH